MYMFHNFIIHSCVYGHLGCFHVPAIVNSVAVNTEIPVSFSVLVSSGGLLGHMVALFLVFKRNLHTSLHSGYINLHSHHQCKKVNFFSTASPTFTACRLFDDGHSDQCEMITSL